MQKENRDAVNIHYRQVLGLRCPLSIKRIAGSIAIAKTDPDAGQTCRMREVKRRQASAAHPNRIAKYIYMYKYACKLSTIGVPTFTYAS